MRPADDDRAGALRLALVDVDPRGHAGFASWCDGNHLPAVAEKPGWRGGLRYGTADDDPFALLLYEAEGPPRGSIPTPLAGPLGRWVRAYGADCFVPTSCAGEFGDAPAVLNAIVVQVVPDAAERFDRWYDEVHVPEILACPGWKGARRLRSDTVPGRFLALYDLEDELRPFATRAYERAVGWDDFGDELLGYHGFRTYRLAHDGRPAA